MKLYNECRNLYAIQNVAIYKHTVFWSTITTFCVKRLLWNSLFDTTMCIAKIEKTCYRKLDYLKNNYVYNLLLENVVTSVGHKRDSLVSTWMSGHALIYKAELHNAITRLLGNYDSLYSYVKLIDNGSHFYKTVLLNYIVIYCIEVHVQAFVITNEIDYCGTWLRHTHLRSVIKHSIATKMITLILVLCAFRSLELVIWYMNLNDWSVAAN